MSSSTTTVNSAQPRQPPPPPPQLSDGLSSLVLSKKYLACARPPHVYKLDHENRDGGGGGEICYSGGGEPSSATPAECWEQAGWGAPPSPVIAAAVQARYEPSDVFTPLVFEEIQPPSPQPPQPPMWIRAAERFPAATVLQVHHHHLHHHQQQHPPQPIHHQPQHHQHMQHHHAPQHATASVAGHPMRRPLQHLPPPAQSSLSGKSSTSDAVHQQLGANKPGDLSWLVNFQVASIFEPTGGAAAGGNVSASEWLQEPPETLKPKRKSAPRPAADQKPSTKISRKPYRMPPSRLDKANKPGYTYTEMIHQALMEKKELPVAEIYQWISSHFPYFREDDERWKNSVRHNLSINPNFRKGRKSQGAGHYWRLCNSEESLGHREFTAIVEDDTSSPQESSELEQACKYLEGELQRDSCLEDVKMHSTIDPELENEIYTNSFLISNPSKYVNEQINMSNNNDFHSYSENILEESIDFQYYNL